MAFHYHSRGPLKAHFRHNYGDQVAFSQYPYPRPRFYHRRHLHQPIFHIPENPFPRMGLFRRSSTPTVVKERSARPGPTRRGTFKDQYVFIKSLGEGGQGKTEACRRKRDGKVLVRKVQKDYSMHGDYPREMYIFENVLSPHPSIVEFDHANYIKANHSLVLYFEHCEGGDLHQYIGTNPSEDLIWQIFIQLADALAFLHYGISRRYPHSRPNGWQRVIHRDIKPANVFLRRRISSRNPYPDVVLGDFGLATLNTVTEGCGTDEWIGPEIPTITKAGDVWGLGAIVHALAHGQGPVPRPPRNWPRDRSSVREWYCDPMNRRPRSMPSRYSDDLNDNMMDCLTIDPSQRVTSQELLRHLEREMPRYLR